jgi:amidase
MQDQFGAFCRHNDVRRPGAAGGPLGGFTFAAKDVFEVEGESCCSGSPDWLVTHHPAAQTASAVRKLLAAGADLAGMTLCDEMTYGLSGVNARYGTPVNPRCPDRVTGGSSSGSAAAVAGGLVEIALGTDTGGSVRIPASLCGVFGIRPTHGRVANDGCMPLAPSFDTVGWFARDANLLARVGEVIFGTKRVAAPGRLLLAVDAMAMADAAVQVALRQALERMGLADAEEVSVYGGEDSDWLQAFRILQAGEVWRAHGQWVAKVGPRFGPGVRDRFQLAANITPEQIAAMEPVRERAARRLKDMLEERAILILPTVPSVAPPKDSTDAAFEEFRQRTLRLTCPAGLARLPQVTLPAGEVDGCPVGLSLIAASGGDELLLGVAHQLAARV